jgi:D-sedoheptulose 7-phosphate isomerase
MLEQRIQQQFFEGADLKYQSAETLARAVADATQALLSTITAGGKVLVCGSGFGAMLALHLQALLLGRFERERPALAALALRPEIGRDGNITQQLQALAQPGDVLVVIDAGEPRAEALAAADEARSKDLTLIVLADARAESWRERLGETDVLVAVPHERAARVMEMQLLILHCLCDALDLQLLGEQEF